MTRGVHLRRDETDRAVALSLVTNIAAAAARALAAVLTGSGALLAGAVHAGADGAAQSMLLASRRHARSARRSDGPEHPSAQHHERLFWPFGLGAMLSTVGGVAIVYEAATRLVRSAQLGDPRVAISIAVATVLWKGVSTIRSTRAIRPHVVPEQTDGSGEPAGGSRAALWRRLRHPKRPSLAMVALQDVTSMISSLVLAASVTGTAMADDPTFDTAGMLSVGVLVIIAALAHLALMKEAVAGHAAPGSDRQRLAAAIEVEPSVVRLAHLETYRLGPDELLLAAKVDLIDGLDQGEIAEAIRRVKASVLRAVPTVHVLYLEPDVCRTQPVGPGGSPALPAPTKHALGPEEHDLPARSRGG